MCVCVFTQDLLLSDSEDSESDLSETEQVALALELHYRKRKRWKKKLRTSPNVRVHKYTVHTDNLQSHHDVVCVHRLVLHTYMYM